MRQTGLLVGAIALAFSFGTSCDTEDQELTTMRSAYLQVSGHGWEYEQLKRSGGSLGAAPDERVRRKAEEEKELILRVFDLKNAKVAQFLIDIMNQPTNAMTKRGAIKSPVFTEQGIQGMLWLLENFDSFSAVGRDKMVFCLERFVREYNWLEAFEIVYVFRRDNHIFAELPAEPPKVEKKISDRAVEGLWMIAYPFLPEDIVKRHNESLVPNIGAAEQYAARKRALLQEWWESSMSDEFRKAMKSIFSDETIDGQLRDKVRTEMGKVKQKIESGQEPPPADTTEMDQWLDKRRPGSSSGK